MTVINAYDDGIDAYMEGRDITNIPGHYSELERELFIEGYQKQSFKIDSQDVPWDNDTDSMKELDFN